MKDMRINTLIVALFALLGLGTAVEKAHAQLVVSVGIAPPALPVYVQPPIPGPGYIWTPGYWAWNADFNDYYWVPGAWVLAPTPGLLWTPGYWGWSGGAYVWNAGYWGPHVGFYGGVSYGFGYTGVGFGGGYWSGGSFFYNKSVTNIGNSTVINNVYNQQVVNNNTTNVSYNGGNGGVQAQPTQKELEAASDRHVPATSEQENHQHLASRNNELRASVNGGRPAIAAVGRAGDFSPHNVVAARAAGSPAKPASFTPANAHSAGPATGTPAANGRANAAVKPNGTPTPADAAHGANKNAGGNQAAAREKPQAAGSNRAASATAHGQPHAAAISEPHPQTHEGAPAVRQQQPHGAPVASAHAQQPHPAAPKPAAHAQPHPAQKPAAHAQPHPEKKKDDHHG